MNKDFIKEIKNVKDISSLLKYIDKWIPCDLEIDGTRKIDLEKRTCEKSKTRWYTSINLSDLIGTDLDLSIMKLEDEEILKYSIGSFFVDHIDGFTSDDMVGSLLYVFPSDDLVGGDLIINNEIKSLKKPYIAYIPTGITHSVTKIENGNRIVLRANVIKDNSKLNKNYDSDDTIEYYIKKGFDIDRKTRIVKKTGKRIPTKKEREKISEKSRHHGMAMRNLVYIALGLPTLKN